VTTTRAISLALSAALLALAITLTVAVRLRRDAVPGPDVLSSVPAFTLTDQTGRPFGPADLRGAPWIASFIFTRCPTVCPALSSRMAEVQRRTEGTPVRLVSFSVDPDFDTPAVLADYAKRFAAGPRWTFLTGDFSAMRAAIEDGLKISMGRARDGPVLDPGQVFHGTHLVLVDGDGTIRGYFDVKDDAGLDALLRDARALAP
jgi:protein SCO1